MIPYLQKFLPKVRSHFVLFGDNVDDKIIFETCSSTKPNIKKSNKYDKLFYEEENNPTKFIYNYSFNNFYTLWYKL